MSTKNTENKILSELELDTLGEILNISMGAAATTISVLLNKQVNITTPVVSIIDKEKLDYTELEPAIGVEINYIEGLHGSNLMIISERDVKVLVATLLGEDVPSGALELDELHMSALSELMNQMMGSASTSLSVFFNKSVNISPPQIYDPKDFYKNLFNGEADKEIVAVSFRIHAENLIDNTFITVMTIKLAKELASNAIQQNHSGDSNETENETIGHKQIPHTVFANEEEKPRATKSNTRKTAMPTAKNSVDDIWSEYENERQRVRQVAMSRKPAATRSVKSLQFESFEEEEENQVVSSLNLDLVMDVELNVTVEIGRAKKMVKDVLNITKGTIIDLDKQAGDPVDVMVNGQLIAKGDVVVIDDNFGVRITQVFGTK